MVITLENDQVIKILTKDEKFWLYVNNIKNIGAPRFSELYFKFKCIEDFAALDFLTSEVKQEIISGAWIDKAEKLLEFMHANNIYVTFYNNKDFPYSLKDIPSPPPILYYIGDIKLLEEPCVSIVGTRKPTSYGREVTKIFASEFAQNGLCVCSGMAEGIDSYAHNFTLDAFGKTVAVLAGGVDFIYPPSNRSLYEKIKENGLIISEYPLSTRPQRQNFTYRNRIVSAISNVVLVVEATANSGTTSTVEHAITQNKTVFAVPGNITSLSSEGTNALIKAGACVATHPCDILEEFGIFKQEIKQAVPKGSNELEDKIISLLMHENRDIDYLMQNIDASVSDINTALMMLEISGIIKRNPGNEFLIKK